MFISKHTLILFILITPTIYTEQNFNELNNRNVSAFDNNIDRMTKSADRNDYKYFDNIIEEGPTVAVTSPVGEEEPFQKRKSDTEKYSEIKGLLAQLLDKIREVEKEKRLEPRELPSGNVTTEPSPNKIPPSPSAPLNNQPKLKKDNSLDPGVPSTGGKSRWGHWTDWSSCSVSCGKGREIRWRHCLQNCQEAETEMEEKVCQLPACSPGKLFGIQL